MAASPHAARLPPRAWAAAVLVVAGVAVVSAEKVPESRLSLPLAVGRAGASLYHSTMHYLMDQLESVAPPAAPPVDRADTVERRGRPRPKNPSRRPLLAKKTRRPPVSQRPVSRRPDPRPPPRRPAPHHHHHPQHPQAPQSPPPQALQHRVGSTCLAGVCVEPGAGVAVVGVTLLLKLVALAALGSSSSRSSLSHASPNITNIITVQTTNTVTLDTDSGDQTQMQTQTMTETQDQDQTETLSNLVDSDPVATVDQTETQSQTETQDQTFEFNGGG